MSTYKGWEAEEQIAIDYLETCRSAVADDEVFAKFKSLQGYKNILEHVTPRQGAEYLQVAMEMAGDALLENLEAFKENDTIGTPDKFSYPETGKISPTTIRYIKNVFEMATLLGEAPISRVVEVGGGYGGLCKTLSVVCDFDEYIQLIFQKQLQFKKSILKTSQNFMQSVSLSVVMMQKKLRVLICLLVTMHFLSVIMILK